jgi:glycosyltransferase involved in cell wall biosynthesis
LSFVFFGIFKLLFLRGKFDKIFVFAPSPITVGIIGILAAKKFKAKSYLWVQDLWPESVIEAGNIKNRFVLDIIDFITKKIYKHSDYILVQSENFIKYIIDQGVDKRKITYIPNYAEEFYHRVEEDKTISKIFRDIFSITFAGNIGESQNLEILVESANILKLKGEQVKFVILGTGRKKNELLQKVREFNVEDYFLFLGRKEALTMPKYFKSSDVMLITLKKSKIFSYTIPSKLQAYMACEKPILGSIDGITQKIITESKSGFASKAGDVNQLVDNIIKLKYLDKYELEKLGKNSHVYYKNNFSKEIVVDKLITMMSL